jgi:salicylate biosynthesis isochorismate synthase/menaquinone-specific isochorismate synthase
LVDLVSAARDAGHEVMLIERPMPDAVSVAAIGRVFDIVAAPGGVALEDETGRAIDHEVDGNRILAAARLWRRVAPSNDAIAVGGFAYRPDRDPGGAWSGFPALLFRVPALAVMRRRGRTFVTAATPDAESLLELSSTAVRAPGARTLSITALRNPLAWTAAVQGAAARLRGGEAEKVVLAREVLARGDGVVSAGMVIRGLRAAYPSCFTYLIAGADGTAFAGASPELLVRRVGGHAMAQPMAGSVARGGSEADDERLARQLTESAKDAAEHRLVSSFVVGALRPFAVQVTAHEPEVVRFTNIQHLATTVEANLSDPPADVLTLAAALHPTPAVGGWPRAAADLLIDELEGMERGWYAGAVGWMDGRGDGELAVALRCGLLWEDGARLYAGVGVMPDSDPARELEETELKFKALLTALV